MKPNLENLDQWLFDSLEGNLNAAQQQELDAFLAQFPDLANEQAAWSNTKFAAKPITFEPKAALYRKKRLSYQYWAAATLLLLLATGYYFTALKSENSDTAQNIAKHSIKQSAEKKSSSAQNNELENTSLTTVSSLKVLGNTANLVSLNNNILSNFVASTHSNSSKQPSIFNIPRIFQQAENTTIENEHLPYLLPKALNGYRTDLRFENLTGTDAEPNKRKLHWNTLQRINDFAQKELGLSNNQSYDLLLPAKSNIDANLSSVGTLSQTRFQSLSFARTGTQKEQAFYGQQISLDGYARKLRAGLGVQLKYKEFASAIRDYEIGLIAAPKIALNKQIILEPAARLRMGARYANANQLQQLSFIEFENADLREVQIDTNYSIGRKLFYKDLDFSLAIQTPILFLSAQLENSFRHFDYAMGNDIDPSESRAAQQLTLAMGTQYASRNEKMRFAPYIIYTSNRMQTQYIGGAQFNFGNWQLGFSAGSKGQYQAAIGYFGKHSALLLQSTQYQLLSLGQASHLHQITFRIYSQNSRQSRRYISL